MQCWECNKEGPLELFIHKGILYDEHCNECRFENFFGCDDETPTTPIKEEPKKIKQPTTKKQESKIQQIKRQAISFQNKIKLEL